MLSWKSFVLPVSGRKLDHPDFISGCAISGNQLLQSHSSSSRRFAIAYCSLVRWALLKFFKLSCSAQSDRSDIFYASQGVCVCVCSCAVWISMRHWDIQSVRQAELRSWQSGFTCLHLLYFCLCLKVTLPLPNSGETGTPAWKSVHRCLGMVRSAAPAQMRFQPAHALRQRRTPGSSAMPQT